MKSKPTCHKSENTFKFESFNERLNKISISSISHLKRRFDADNDNEDLSFFATAIDKWHDLNCTQDFKVLCRKIGNPLDIQNLVQIIHRKNELIEILIQALKNKENKATNAILELIVALARDLQSDFYEYFSVIFEILVELSCEIGDVDLIEAIFVCQTFLFKYLWKYILKDIEQHYETIQKALLTNKEYILNFSGESFSFLIRKSKRPSEIFAMLFKSLQTNQDLSRGVGRILFESVKGVNHALFSQCNVLFRTIFEKFYQCDNDCLDSSMQYFIECLLDHTTAETFKIVWKYLNFDSPTNNLIKSILLTNQVILYKKGKSINDCDGIITSHVKYLTNYPDLDLEFKHKILSSIESIFTNKHNALSTETVNYFGQCFYCFDSPILSFDQIFTFSKQILESPISDIQLNNFYYKFCLNIMQTGNEDNVLICLNFLAYLIVYKRPRPLYGEELSKISKYPIEFEDCEIAMELLLDYLNRSTDLKTVWLCLIIIPHLMPINNPAKVCNSISTDVIDKIELLLATCQSSDGNNRDLSLVASLLLESIYALILLKSQDAIIDEIDCDKIIDYILLYPNVTELLQCLDIYLTYNKRQSQKFGRYKIFNSSLPRLYSTLENNFCSHFRLNRMLSLHIMTLCDFVLPTKVNELEDFNQVSIFEICLNAENTPVELSQYRERLKHVRKLDCNFVSYHIPEPIGNIEFDMAPVHFILGTLYENLSLLWKPTLEILETYARLTADKKKFTDILFRHLNLTNSLISTPMSSRFYLIEEYFGIKIDSNLVNLSFVPDYLNHRQLLLKSFEMFSDLIEKRNREFVGLFFEFTTFELNSHFIFGVTTHEDIRLLQEVDHQENDSIDLSAEPESTGAKFLWKTFFAYLSVFGKFKNPKSLYRESELLQLYLNMLLSPNSTVQKHAMTCLLTYNQSHLVKYKDIFLRLLDDKSFSSEIQSFMLHDNSEDNILIVDDRPKVIPIFLRILYGKMLSSSGAKLHGKSRIDFLRSIILKVLASFNEDEQTMFMDLVFSSLSQLLSVDYDKIFVEIDSFINIESFIPFRQFQSFITTLEFIMKHFGNKSNGTMHYMFKVLVTCSSICNRLLSDKYRTQIKRYILNSLKSIRSNCFKVANYYFSHFDKYPFTAIEIDALFTGLITPLITNIAFDSLSSPSPIVKLFNIWSENPRYHVLLAKQIDPVSDFTPIKSLIQLYSNLKIMPESITYVTNIIENLLTYDSFDPLDDSEVLPIDVNNFGKPLPTKLDFFEYSNQNINFGSLLLIPFISNILERIHSNYLMNISTNSKFMFSLQEINVMARLSFYIKNSSDSKTVSILLIRSISQSRRPDEDKEVFTLKTLNNLANNLNEDSFSEIFHLLFPLFNLVDKPLSRRELCILLTTLCKKNKESFSIAKLIEDINSYDVRSPEEPDYTRRISGFKLIMNLLDSFNELNPGQLDLIHLLLENCSFTINTFEDMSLKELSSDLVVKISRLFKDSKEEIFNRYVMNLILYKIIARGFRQEKESVRHTYIEILIAIIKIFPDKHPTIGQLSSLCNEDEEEVDFWQNIKHIQLHRRARALSRLVQDSAFLQSLSSRVFTSFLIPLTSHFISDTLHYAKNVALFNASIDAFAIFLQHCSWFKYDSTLSHYINRLLNNKIDPKVGIKIISALLENFTFLKAEDVSQIEMELNADDFKNFSLEYSVGNLKSKKNNNKKGKFNKKKKNLSKKESSKNETQTGESMQVDVEIDTKNVSSIEEIDENINIAEDEELDAKENRMIQCRKIYNSFCKKLLPQLHKCLHQKSEIEYTSDSHKEDFPVDDEIQRIPIAIAIVKLLKHIHLNQKLLDANLTSIFLRLCQFLQSRTESIRETSRNTFVQILQTLGPKYFQNVFYDMKSLLTRGYQRHIFVYTVYILLYNLVPQLSSGDLDSCLGDVIEVCHTELFGNMAEEKEISQIVTKTKEAKKMKGYDIYEILAQFVSESSLKTMLNPIKKVLSEATNHKVMKVTEKAFYKIGRGLVANKFIPIDILTNMLIEIFSSTQPEMDNSNEHTKIEPLSQKLPKKIDSFLIPVKSLRRIRSVSRINRSSNSYILTDFALTCYLYLLKNNRFVKTNPSHVELLGSTLEYLNLFLHSKDSKVITSTMNCFHVLLTKFPELSSFRQVTQDIISQIFVLLNKYSGLSGDNSQLIALCFKTMGYFISNRSDCKLSNEEISVLLSYAEKDIENNKQNSTIYFLLKSIISRKFTSKELHVLMEKLTVLAITSDIDFVRSHATELSIKYLTEYPIEPTRFKGKIVKLVRQLEFKSITGRISAITILKSVINYLNYDTIEPLKNHLFAPIALRLVNEESAECKKLIADTILKILSKLTSDDIDNFFETFVVPWLSSDDILAVTLASNLCSLFVTYEKQNFIPRIGACLPMVRQQLDPSRFKSLSAPSDENEEDISTEMKAQYKNEDNLIFHHLNFVLKLLQLENNTQLLTKAKFYNDFNEIFDYTVSDFLLHPHSWIRCLSTQLFGQLFSLFNPESFIHDIDLYRNSYLFKDSLDKFKQLCSKFCLIFRDLYNCTSVAEQLTKNLIYVARVFIVFEHSMKNETENQSTILRWLINKLIFEVKYEIKSSPENVQKRMLCFKWIAATAVQLGNERVIAYLPNLLPILCRQDLTTFDISTTEQDKDELVNLNKQVLQLIRNLIGSDKFIDHFNQIRNQISHQRLERRKNRAIQMVTQTDLGVKRKQRKHKLSQNAKKRKVSHFKVK